jgi:putative heme iron utilization protein
MFVLSEEINIYRGSTYKHTFYLVDNDGGLLDASGYEARLQVKAKRGDIKVLADLSEYLDTTTYAAQGIILLTIPHEYTSGTTLSRGVFDLLVKKTLTGEISRAAVGTLKATDGITRF